MGYIYKIINLINNKIYIGQTTRNIQIRLREHISKAYDNKDKLYLHSAIRKYGEENFIIETIEQIDDSILDDREQYWIKYYNSNNKEIGYNLTNGGAGNQKTDWSLLYKLWDEGLSIKRISEVLQISPSSITKVLKYYQNYDEKESLKRGYLEQGINVNKYSLNGDYLATYNSFMEAAGGNEQLAHSIGQCCSNKLITAGGFQWRVYNGDKNNITPAIGYKLGKRKVNKYSLNNELLDTYPSLIAAAKSLVNDDKARSVSNQIQQVCKGNRKTAYGYIWKYQDD